MNHSIIAYGSLGLALISLLIQRKNYLPYGLLIVSLIFAYMAKHIADLGLSILLGIGALWYLWYKTAPSKYIKFLYFLLLSVLSVALMRHLLPGFHNWLVLPKHQFSPLSSAENVYLNYDTAFIGLCILLLNRNQLFNKANWKTIINTTLILLPFCIAILALSGLLKKYIAWDPKFPPDTLLWAARNLFFVCIAEECFFRGFLQNTFANFFKNQGFPAILSVFLAAICFGLYHYAGGHFYVLLATIAGIFYGISYHLTRTLEAPILLHFALNATHFLFFTYPHLKV